MKVLGTAIASIDSFDYFPGNAKKHDDYKIRQSIMLYGFFQTLLVDKRTDCVLGGNGRLEALRYIRDNPDEAEVIKTGLCEKYGLADPEISYPPAGISVGKDGEWFVNILEIETTSDAEAIAINLQDNFSVLDGGDFTLLDKSRAFDVDAMLAQLETLDKANFLPVSVESGDLDSLLKELEERNNGDDLDKEGGDWASAFEKIKEGEKEPFQQMTITLHDEQKDIVDDTFAEAKKDEFYDESINQNSNGNALFTICQRYLNGIS